MGLGTLNVLHLIMMFTVSIELGALLLVSRNPVTDLKPGPVLSSLPTYSPFLISFIKIPSVPRSLT
jgi:hypothetical protein